MTVLQTPWWRRPAANGSERGSGDGPAFHRPAPQGSAAPFWFLVGFTFILLLAPQERYSILAPLRIAMIAVLLTGASHVVSRLSRGLPVMAFNAPTRLLVGLVFWALITVPFSYWPGGSVTFFLEIFAKTVLVFLLLANVVDSEDKLHRISWGLVLMSIPLALSTIGHFMSGTSLETGDRVAGYAAGLTANPNDMALMLNLILPLCIALWLAATRTDARLLLAATACLVIAAIVATFSRGGFLTLLTTGVMYAWLYRSRAWIWAPLIIVLAMMALPIVPSGYLERISTIVNIEDDATSSAETRLGDIKSAARLATVRPLTGFGIGMNVLALNESRGETWTAVHNVYLQYLIELGLPGLALFLLLYFYCLRATGMVSRVDEVHRPRRLRYVAEGLRVSLIAFAVAALFHPVAYHFYFYYIAGLAVAAETIVLRAVRAGELNGRPTPRPADVRPPRAIES